MNKIKEAWAGFVYRLREAGYWGDPEKFRDYFNGYFKAYFDGKQSLEGVLQHCTDPLDDYDFQEAGQAYMESVNRSRLSWTDEDLKKAEKEKEMLEAE